MIIIILCMFRRFRRCIEFKVLVLFVYLGFIWPRLLDDYMCIYTCYLEIDLVSQGRKVKFSL